MNRSISALISISIAHSADVKFSMCVLFLSSQPLKFLRISLPSRSRICSLISAASNGELNSPRNRGPVAMRRDSSTAMAAIAPVRIFAEINHKIYSLKIKPARPLTENIEGNIASGRWSCHICCLRHAALNCNNSSVNPCDLTICSLYSADINKSVF